MDFDTWIGHLREEVQHENSYLKIANNKWQVVDRRKLWKSTASRLFDVNLERFKEAAVDVFRVTHPKFEVVKDERYMYMANDDQMLHSESIREGMAETLALLGIDGNLLSKCSLHLPEQIAMLTIREIFEEADWKLWGSMNYQLPTLAEASPVEYLSCIERALKQQKMPFEELFKQEGGALFGNNYMSGVLWSLEVLAWQPELLSRVSVLLAELADQDPGGQWANRPINSLITIFLPWFPQTHGDVEFRFAAFRAIKEDFPDVAWSLAKELLPNQHQSTSGSYKPKWRDPLPDDWQPEVNNSDYNLQIIEYSRHVVELAKDNANRLVELIDNLDNLPPDSFSNALNLLSEQSADVLTSTRKRNIWERLNRFTRKHRKYSDAKWALPPDSLERIDVVSDKLAPTDLKDLHAYMFDNNDHDLHDDKGDFEAQEKRLNDKRAEIVAELYRSGGLDELIAFSKIVKNPFEVGFKSAIHLQAEDESSLFPNYLRPEFKEVADFIRGIVSGKYSQGGWQWVDSIDRSSWTHDQNVEFLLLLPFTTATWNRVDSWLGETEKDYWIKTSVNPYQSDEVLEPAIEKLLSIARPNAALQCLEYMHFKNIPCDPALIVRALTDAITDRTTDYALQDHYIRDLISDLQGNQNVNVDDLFKVEWAYLPLLSGSSDVAPKVITDRLAKHPEFFCEILQLIFRSTHTDKKMEPNEEKQAIASNAWRLLGEWRSVPGAQKEGEFNWQEFEAWYSKVLEICTESGHIEVAKIKIGELLFYTPPDSDGLWINLNVARLLNRTESSEMRRGFNTQVFNSRGVHWVDPEAKEERELAEFWRKRAEEVEKQGLARFATALREISASYEREVSRRTAGSEIDRVNSEDRAEDNDLD